MNKILLFIKTPPPITGVTLMNKHILESKLLNESFKIRLIQISYVRKVNEFGSYNLRKPIIFIKIFFQLIYECLSHRPKFIYFQISPLGFAFYRDLFFVCLIKLFNIKIVFHLHGKGIKNEIKKKWKKKIYQFAFKGEEIICLSHLLTYDIEDIFKEKVHIVNNGIPDLKPLFESPSFNSTNEKKNILFLSNLIKSKGILDFLESLNILNNRNVDFHANIIGAEADINANLLAEKLKEYNISRKVTYLGSKYDHEKYEILVKTNILIYPSFNDAFPLVLLEAMQFGIPIIATKEGAIPDIIDDGVTGFIVEVRKPDKITDKIEVLIKTPLLCDQMGAAGRKKFLERFTIDKFEANLYSVFNEILGVINN